MPLYRHLVSGLENEGPIELGYILLPKDVSRFEFCLAKWAEDELAIADERAREIIRAAREAKFWPPTVPSPDFFDEFAAICRDHVV